MRPCVSSVPHNRKILPDGLPRNERAFPTRNEKGPQPKLWAFSSAPCRTRTYNHLIKSQTEESHNDLSPNDLEQNSSQSA